MKLADRPARCVVCDGLGYLHCECWPGDCICGRGHEPCDECMGDGVIYDDWPDLDDDHEDLGR